MNRDAADLVLQYSRCSESYKITLLPSLGFGHYLWVQIRRSFSVVLILHTSRAYTVPTTAILAAVDKADTKIPLYTEMDDNIPVSAVPQHVTGTMW